MQVDWSPPALRTGVAPVVRHVPKQHPCSHGFQTWLLWHFLTEPQHAESGRSSQCALRSRVHFWKAAQGFALVRDPKGTVAPAKCLNGNTHDAKSSWSSQSVTQLSVAGRPISAAAPRGAPFAHRNKHSDDSAVTNSICLRYKPYVPNLASLVALISLLKKQHIFCLMNVVPL